MGYQKNILVRVTFRAKRLLEQDLFTKNISQIENDENTSEIELSKSGFYVFRLNQCIQERWLLALCFQTFFLRSSIFQCIINHYYKNQHPNSAYFLVTLTWIITVSLHLSTSCCCNCERRLASVICLAVEHWPLVSRLQKIVPLFLFL